MKTGILAVSMLALMPLPVSRCESADVTSALIASGNWTDAAAWDSGDIPNNSGMTFNAVVPSRTVTLSSASPMTIDGLQLIGGTIKGDGLLTLLQPSTWTSGSIAGNPTIDATDLAISGSANIASSATFTNHGSTNWLGGSGIHFGSNAVFDNQAVLDLKADGFALRNNSLGNGSRLDNRGTLRKSAANGVTSIRLDVDDSGLIDVQTGTLRLLSSDNSRASGQYQIANGSVLEISDRSYALERIGDSPWDTGRKSQILSASYSAS